MVRYPVAHRLIAHCDAAALEQDGHHCDLESERLIVEALRQHFPNDAIIAV
jgi:fructose-1,6-bisphosphatase/inositol monophosphatase family enzyme